MRFRTECDIIRDGKTDERGNMHGRKREEMMKRLIAWGLACLLLMGCLGAAQAEGNALTAGELLAFLEEMKARALESEPLNNPESEEAQSEDGTAFVYDFATLYAEGTQLTAETVIRACVMTDPEEIVFRSVSAEGRVQDWISRFRNDNPALAGTREGAMLYLGGTPEDGWVWGRVFRDGQRIQSVEYGAVEQTADGLRWLSAVFTVEEGNISRMRLENRFPEENGEAVLAEQTELMRILGQEQAYTQTVTSLNGLELTPLTEADLTIGDVPFLSLTPGSFGGSPDDVLIDNDDGTWLRVVEGDGFTAVFSCDARGENARILSYTVLDEETEGPRHVRLGDLFHEDFTRFRSGEQETDGVTEVLYGTEGQAPYGVAYYADGNGMTLRYVTPTEGGQDVELYLHYEGNVLAELILHTVSE